MDNSNNKQPNPLELSPDVLAMVFSQVFTSEEMEGLREAARKVQAAQDFFSKSEKMKPLRQLIRVFQILGPYIEQEIAEVRKLAEQGRDPYPDGLSLEVFLDIMKKATRRKEAEEAGSLISSPPEKHVIPNNQLANKITEDLVNAGKRDFKENDQGVATVCMLTYEKNENVTISGRQPFSEYDRNVYNAVCSLYVYGDSSHVITPAMVFRAMTGQKCGETPSAKHLAAVEDSLDRMRFIRTRIDCSEVLRAWGATLNGQQVRFGEVDTYLLCADVLKVKAGGRFVKAYRILKAPILYEYAQAMKQVLTVDASLLDIKEVDEGGFNTQRSLANTEIRILIKGYLIRRIEGMKGDNNLDSDLVKLENLYRLTGKTNPDRVTMKRIRKDAEGMLKFWEAVGYIKKYEVQVARKKITAYKITV